MLRFHKRGKDGSGKCDAFYTGVDGHRLFGVVFGISQEQSKVLDCFEGPDYERRSVSVRIGDGAGGGLVDAYAYVAFAHAIDTDLAPYPWYHAFVLHGATVGGLPEDYLRALRAVTTNPDPDAQRQAENHRILYP